LSTTTTTTTTTPTFADLGVPGELTDVLTGQGITAPFPIQSLTIQDALAGRDLCGKAPTGSGKTLAFSLPVAMRVGRATPGRPRALLLVPTRELAAQVRDTLAPLVQVTGRRIATFYGGTNLNTDLKRLRGRIDVAVATPGRLEDLLDRRAISLADVDLVVLDEADRMADMGFLPVVKRLLDRTRDDRQTLLFSATLDGDVDVLVRRYQRDPARHEFAVPAEERGDIKHVFWPAERHDRRALTAKIVRHSGQAIVFTRTKHGADRLAKQLAKDGVRTAAIHGNRNQNQRERALASFADGDVHALIATDVAARGIHVDDVAVVVHFDPPATGKDYVHRSGRTGRAGSEGLVVSLVGDEQLGEVRAMQRELGLPSGLHELDLALLAATELPAPTPGTGARREERSTPNRDGRSARGQASRGQASRGQASSGRRKGGGNGRSGHSGQKQSAGGGQRHQPRGGARSTDRRRTR
jgi:superfamily II DNA/RNA helicase